MEFIKRIKHRPDGLCENLAKDIDSHLRFRLIVECGEVFDCSVYLQIFLEHACCRVYLCLRAFVVFEFVNVILKDLYEVGFRVHYLINTL